MALGIKYVCSHCAHSIEVWDDGNPYFLSDKGRPQYYYHPNDREVLQEYIRQSEGKDLVGYDLQIFLEKRTGNMTELMCLDCGKVFKRDLDKKKAVCPSRNCKSTNITDVCKLNKKCCPICKQGHFHKDDKWFCIS